jgi:hypothetical protein
MSKITEMLGIAPKPHAPSDETPPDEEIDLNHKLPFLFEESLRFQLNTDERVLGTLFVPSERLSDADFRPARALLITDLGLLFMEEGEDQIANQRWGVHTRFYSYNQIAFLEIGNALLRGRFAIYGTAGHPPTELILRWYDVNNFRAAMALIRKQMSHSQYVSHVPTEGTVPCGS